MFATTLSHAMRANLASTSVPYGQRAALAQQLRESAGTYARTVHLSGPVAHAADVSLATAASRGVLVTAGILAVGLLLTLRLGSSGSRPARHPGE